MNSKDVKQLFAEKNKEIVLNKLKLDIANNFDTLTITLNNIFNFEFDNLYKKCILMLEDVGLYEQKQINNELFTLYAQNIKKNVNELIIERNKYLVMFLDEIIISDNLINLYTSKISDSSQKLMNDFASYIINYYEKEIKITFKMLLNKRKEKSFLKRFNKYFANNFINNLKDKFNNQLLTRDNFLINNAQETYCKYLNLVDKTQ